jgi:signal peptidase I
MKHVLTHTIGDKPPAPSMLQRLTTGLGAVLTGRKVFVVPNQSMLSTLRIRDTVLLDESAYHSSPIRRGDIVVYRSLKHEGVLLPSRVIGLPNETVELRDRKLHIDGILVQEPYVDSDASEQKHSRFLNPILVPPDHVFLIGDFRDLSEDSRFIGAVHQNLLVGRITLET